MPSTHSRAKLMDEMEALRDLLTKNYKSLEDLASEWSAREVANPVASGLMTATIQMGLKPTVAQEHAASFRTFMSQLPEELQAAVEALDKATSVLNSAAHCLNAAAAKAKASTPQNSGMEL